MIFAKALLIVSPLLAAGRLGFFFGKRKRPVDTRARALEEHSKLVAEASTAHELGFTEQAEALERAAQRTLHFADRIENP